MNRYPSKRPSVKQVTEWNTVFIDEIENDWRGMYGGTCIVQVGYPFPDFYKVVTHMGKIPTTKTTKYFYGETAYHKVVNYVADLGFRTIYSATLY